MVDRKYDLSGNVTTCYVSLAEIVTKGTIKIRQNYERFGNERIKHYLLICEAFTYWLYKINTVVGYSDSIQIMYEYDKAFSV